MDGQTVTEAKESFEEWVAAMLQSIHRKGYRAPDIRRVYIPKPGKQEKRPLGVPTVADRALQRSASQVLSTIYEQDFLPCSFGGRLGRGAHQALATLNERIAGGKIEWVLEADLKNFFGSLSHEWMLRFMKHRVGNQRLISLRRWLKAGVLEDGEVHPSEEGTPQGGSVSVLLSNVYLHYVLDLWFERVVKPRLRGEACMVRYRRLRAVFPIWSGRSPRSESTCEEAGKVQADLGTEEDQACRIWSLCVSACQQTWPETLGDDLLSGFTLYCTRNRKGNFRIGMRTEKTRLRRALTRLQDQMRQMRHLSLQDQVNHLNQMLRGHYVYYGIGGNFRSLQRVHRAVERYWRKMLSSRSWHGTIYWTHFQRIKEQFPLLRPKLYLPYTELQAIAVL